MPKFNATSRSDSSLPWSLYGNLPCSKVTVLPSGRKVTSTVFSLFSVGGASIVVVPVPCVFSSDMYQPLENCFIQNLPSPPDGRLAARPRDRCRLHPWPCLLTRSTPPYPSLVPPNAW